MEGVDGRWRGWGWEGTICGGLGWEMGVEERANGVREVGNNVVEEGKKAVLEEEMWGWGVQPTAFLLFLQML